MKPIVARAGERLALAIGLLCGAVGMAIYGCAASGLAFSLGTPVLMFWGLSSAAQSMMTHRVGLSEQGELQGAIGSLRGVATLAGPALFPLVLAAAVGPLHGFGVPGAPWVRRDRDARRRNVPRARGFAPSR